MRNLTTAANPHRIPALLAIMAIAVILAFAAVIIVSARDAHGEMLITWDAHTQTAQTLLNYRVAWTPEGESFKKVSVSFTDDVYTRTVTNKATAVVVTPPNVAPTGLPTITGTAEAR